VPAGLASIRRASISSIVPCTDEGHTIGSCSREAQASVANCSAACSAFEAAIYDSIVTAERILQRIDDRLYTVPQPWP
jgi:hypothetical protein